MHQSRVKRVNWIQLGYFETTYSSYSILLPCGNTAENVERDFLGLLLRASGAPRVSFRVLFLWGNRIPANEQLWLQRHSKKMIKLFVLCRGIQFSWKFWLILQTRISLNTEVSILGKSFVRQSICQHCRPSWERERETGYAYFFPRCIDHHNGRFLV